MTSSGTAIIMKSMPMFKGSIKNVTYENLVLHNVRTGVCINTASQTCSNRDMPGYTGRDSSNAELDRLRGDGSSPAASSFSSSLAPSSLSQLGFMNVEGVTIRNVTGYNVQLAGYLNCPRGNCTGLLLQDVNFAGAKPYFCDGPVDGVSKGCHPPTCPLSTSDHFPPASKVKT